MAEVRPGPPLRVFLSYSHRDAQLCERFLVHLSQLRRQGLIEPWHDRRITAGGEWADVIDERLNAAHLIVLLVSADFLASDYCNDIEMARAIERGKKGEARVVPVILKPCDWETSRLAGFQVLPKNGKPVVDWETNDHGFNDAVQGLRRLIIELCGSMPVRTQVLQVTFRRHWWRWASGVLLAALLAVAAWFWYQKQGTDLLTSGERKYARGDRQGALADFQAEVKRRPRQAEAYFRMGRVLDLEGNPDSALRAYQKAAALSHGTARYHHNLADLYFRREEYDKAIEEYGRMGQFPLAALELAKIYRLQDRLEEARGREEDAIRWLKDPAIQNAERENAWAFEVSPVRQARLGPLAEKQCYADLELAVTRFLQGDEHQAAGVVPAAFAKCSSRRAELEKILRWELRRLGTQTPKHGKRSEAFVQKFLGPEG
jgi:hypothetical protein